MQKETILAKSRAENQSFDEREHQELRNSFGFGGVIICGVIICCICLLFSAIEAIRGGYFFGYGTIIFAYLAGISWYHYKISKQKKALALGLASSLVAVIGLVSFLVFG